MTRTVFSGGLLYDGTTAEPAPGDVVVEGDRIVAVGGPGTGDGDEQVDCAGGFVSPGFFDCHVHVMFQRPDYLAIMNTPFSLGFYQAIGHLKATLETGITSVRDASGADWGVREAVERGLVAGPHLQIAITMLSQTGGHGDPWQACGAPMDLLQPHPGRPDGVVDGVEEVRRKVRELVRDGADVIKVATTGGVLSPLSNPRHAHFRDAEIEVMVQEAHAAGIEVMAHAQGTEGVAAAVRAGVRSIEHGIYLDEPTVELMLERGTWLVPTLHAPRAVVAAADAGVGIPASSLAKAREVIAAHDESVRLAHAAGVKIAMGTDCGVGEHGTNLLELELMADCGLSATQALHATTGSAADLLRVGADRGRLAEGLRADLVVVEGDPADVAGLRERVWMVYKNGTAVHVAEPATEE